MNKALESLIHTQEWRQLEEYVFLHILAQENLSLTEGQLFQVRSHIKNITGYWAELQLAGLFLPAPAPIKKKL